MRLAALKNYDHGRVARKGHPNLQFARLGEAITSVTLADWLEAKLNDPFTANLASRSGRKVALSASMAQGVLPMRPITHAVHTTRILT